MTSRDFAFWLQGFFELTNPESITPEQVFMIQKHLNLVFVHEIDPSMGDHDHQDQLNAIHNTKPEDVHWGPQPHPGWKLSSLHGWYDPKQGTPRC
jgi:hypothetical protein